MKRLTLLIATLLLSIAGMSVAQNTPMHGWHTYCGSDFNNAIGDPVPIIIATCYPPDMAINYAGTAITKVGMFSDDLYTAVGGLYSCTIYLGGETPAEGTIAYTMTVDVPQGLGDWAEFDLTTPVGVTGDETIWIVWEAVQQLTACPMGVCGISDPSGNGNWSWTGLQWEHSDYGDWTVKTYFNWDNPLSQPQDVYVSGNHFTTGKVFKNNTLLYSITDSIDIQLKGIQVAEDGAVYGAGYAYNDTVLHGCVWMNDSCIFTADTNTYFDHIALNGNDWTVAGFNNVWQNGELLYSYSHGDDECHIQGLAVDTTTGDIYAGGAVYLSGEYLTYASVWKNDSLLWMEDTISSIYGLSFDGENLYTAGYKFGNDSLCYGVIWQNDSIIYQMENANFVCITAFDNSLYWSGISLTDTIVRIWQNGEVLFTLPELSGISNLVVNENGVYYTDAQTVYKDGEVLYQPEEWCIITDLVVKPVPSQPEYTITVEANNPDWGVVNGGGTYHYGDTATIEAIPNVGCEFLYWNDSITDNPREIVVTQDSTFIAYFGLLQYTITVESDNPDWGSVTGGGTFYYGDTIQIEAIANHGYMFSFWNDGIYDNPRTIIVTEDQTFIAHFGLQQCIIQTGVFPEGAGTVTGAGPWSYLYGDTITLTAQNNFGYIFSHWDDGVTDNPRTIIVEGDATYIAIFTPLQYEITTECDPVEGGTVTGAGIYDYGSIASLTATPNENYIFLCWSDGIVSNPRHVTVTGNAHYKAIFHHNGSQQYTISVMANDTTLGTVNGSGTYPQGAIIEISATPYEGAFFKAWDDGNTDNPRNVVVIQDQTFTAFFDIVPPFETYTITVRPESPLLGSTYGSGVYSANQVIHIGATPNLGFYFSGWQDGNMDNPRTIIVTGDAEYIASFAQNPVMTYTIYVYCDENQGFILGAGTYIAGSTATLAAIPADGYMFVKWSDDTTDNPKEILVDHDIVLSALFDRVGIDENGLDLIRLFPNPATDEIRIEGLQGENIVQIYNAFGMLVKTSSINGDDEISIEELPAGLYILRIGGQIMRVMKK